MPLRHTLSLSLSLSLSLCHRLLDMISLCFGPLARSSVDDIHSDQLPVILIVLKSKGTVAIRNIIQGGWVWWGCGVGVVVGVLMGVVWAWL